MTEEQSTSELATSLREEIRRRFPGTRMEFLSGEEVVRIPCPSGAIGDLYIMADEIEATISVEGMGHYHLYPYETSDRGGNVLRGEGNEEVISNCCEFLENLFRDEIVVWSTPNQRYHGYYPRFEEGDDLDSPPAGARAGTWSAPVEFSSRPRRTVFSRWLRGT